MRHSHSNLGAPEKRKDTILMNWYSWSHTAQILTTMLNPAISRGSPAVNEDE